MAMSFFTQFPPAFLLFQKEPEIVQLLITLENVLDSNRQGFSWLGVLFSASYLATA